MVAVLSRGTADRLSAEADLLVPSLLISWLMACGSAPEPAPVPPIREPAPVRAEAESRPEPASPAWHATERCVHSDGAPTRRTPSDLDGDGTPDSLSISGGSGSSSSADFVRLSLSERGTIELDFAYGFNQMAHRFPIPEALVGLPAARKAIARRLWDTRCDRPDPSLRWLLRFPRELEWIEGEAELPPFYAFEDPHRQAWLTVAGHMHAAAAAAEEVYPALADRRADQRLLVTAHGVILQEEGRYAWLWVTPAHAKLRWKSVEGAHFDGDAVRIERAPSPIDETTPDPIVVDLETGAVTPPQRPLLGAAPGDE